MNVNSYFSKTESRLGNIPRSGIDRSFNHRTTFNAGKLVPIFSDEWILPGDTITLDLNAFVRMSTPIHPVMDDAYLDINFFAVPYRLVWDEFEKFMGAADNPEDWKSPNYPLPPTILLNNDPLTYGYVKKGSVLDYLNIPVNDPDVIVDSVSGFVLPMVNAFLPRAYALIYNDWYRAESIDDPAYVAKDSRSRHLLEPSAGDTDDTLDDPIMTAHLGGACFTVNKFFDYYTSALPSPQRGPAVGIPISQNPLLPVGPQSDTHTFGSGPIVFTGGPSDSWSTLGGYADMDTLSADLQAFYSSASPGVGDGNGTNISINNLWSKLSVSNLGTINDLRVAFQIQKMMETEARSGTRYTSLIQGHFGVRSPDARLQRSEYLGGKRIRIGMQQVAQTSSTDETSPQGNLAAYSLTSDSGSYFTYSATEHCMLLGLACVRTKNSYAFGVNKNWFVRDRFDVYWPELANIGELPIWNDELFAYHAANDVSYDGLPESTGIFGYQEAWAQYRYKNNVVSGAFRPQLKQSLDVWTYVDDYSTAPSLSPGWLQQGTANVDRTLAVTSELEDQFLADFKFYYKMYRPMPLYSIPGLADHH